MTTSTPSVPAPRRVRLTAISMMLAASLIGTGSFAQAREADALAILESMTDYVGSQTSLEFSFDSSIEVITPELEKIQFTNSGGALLNRPDKLRAHRVGGYADVELVFDGRTVSMLGKSRNVYAQFDGPESVDALIEALRSGQGVALPGADLLLTNAYEVLTNGILEAKHIGRGVIDGLECEHLAFRNRDTDWQLWVEVGERPIPRKLVITSKTLNSAPQYTLQVKDWKTGVTPAADAFAFTPPQDAQRLEAHELVDLDELPPDAAPGDNP
ncbi:DUF2092 domain-containing protein [Thiococcus pfennigii]|uniref:DUF2092 domain-containing protein n=1 Tax=Thiococcus pfennigii TaxID=1057 RepID=UPI0019077960|nr:DUF2092 domain-containing protein [Thiococcus pfennigii]MBK1732891.1 hypothetical protein [Thiococcus pfennigii]